MEAAAALVGLVGFALASTKNLYQVISSIRNGPETVATMKTNLKEMTSILQLMEAQAQPGSSAEGLADLIKSYNSGIKQYEGKISKIQLIPTDTRSRRFWRQVKRHIQENDLDCIDKLLQQQMTKLSLHLNISESQRSKEQASSLERIEAKLQAQFYAAQRIEDGFTPQLARTDQLTQETQAYFSLINGLGGDVNNIQVHQNRNHRSTLQSINNGVDTIVQNIAEQTSTSRTQFENTMSGIEQLKALVQGTRNLDPIDGVSLPAGRKRAASITDDADHAAKRFRSLIHDSERTLYDDEAYELFQDLDELVKSMQHGYAKRPRSEVGVSSGNFKRLRSSVSGCPSVVINSSVNKPKKVPIGLFNRHTEMFSERYSEWGNMMIYVRKASRKQSPHAKVKSSEGEQPVHVLEKAITMCIQDREMICISVSFVQEIYARKSLNIGPVIFASYIIPDGSDVVDAIKEGDVDRLKELLVSGEVKLYSRDWDGRSLLNLAMSASKPGPAICKFLVESGAEVDFTENDEQGYAASCLELGYWRLSSSFECMRMVLRAGTDPFIEFEGRNSSFIGALKSGASEFLELLLIEGGDFIDINGKYKEEDKEIEETPLLIALYPGVEPYWNPGTIRVLLQYGSNPNDVNILGQSAIHLPFYGSFYSDVEDISEVLCMLLQAGANVYAKDLDGLTPSHYACNKLLQYGVGRKFKVNKDLRLLQVWKKALAACGNNPEQVINDSVGADIAEFGWERHDETCDGFGRYPGYHGDLRRRRSDV